MSKGPFYAEGQYVGIINSLNVGKAKTGNPQIELRFTVLRGKDGIGNQFNIEQQYDRTIFASLHGGAAEFTIDMLNDIGWYGTDFNELLPSNPKYFDCKGQEIDLYCKHKQRFGGEPGEMVEDWMLSREREIVELDRDRVGKLNTMFGTSLKNRNAKAVGSGLLKSAPKPNTAAKAEHQPAAACPPPDDLPF